MREQRLETRDWRGEVIRKMPIDRISAISVSVLTEYTLFRSIGGLLTCKSQERHGQDDQTEGNPVVGKRLEGVGLDVAQQRTDDNQGHEK